VLIDRININIRTIASTDLSLPEWMNSLWFLLYRPRPSSYFSVTHHLAEMHCTVVQFSTAVYSAVQCITLN
jgi:hypothetical protein